VPGAFEHHPDRARRAPAELAERQLEGIETSDGQRPARRVDLGRRKVIADEVRLGRDLGELERRQRGRGMVVGDGPQTARL
jgi:hypothetical protein